MDPASDSADIPAFRAALAGWFERHQRALPWRLERTLYRTVVSEFMLQQTQVATVLPYFARWMTALPDFPALAAASESEVLKLWEGLGYYRRARFLHRLAQEWTALDEKPTTAVAWATLTGVGPYTAAAIASLAFGDPAACVDGNVVRILARVTGDASVLPDGASAVKRFIPAATALLDHAHPGRHNEAMMELGATVCTRSNPLCILCPVASWCEARRQGTVAAIPNLARTATEKREVDRVWCLRDGSLLLHRIPDAAARMNGLHELPSAAQAGVSPTDLNAAPLLATRQRSITRYRITERIHRVDPASLAPADDATLLWISLDRLDAIILSGPHRRWVRELLASET